MLVADDEPPIRLLCQVNLAVAGIEVLQAADGEVHLAEETDRRLVIGDEHEKARRIGFLGLSAHSVRIRQSKAVTRGSPGLRRVAAEGGRTRVASRGAPVRSSCA